MTLWTLGFNQGLIKVFILYYCPVLSFIYLSVEELIYLLNLYPEWLIKYFSPCWCLLQLWVPTLVPMIQVTQSKLHDKSEHWHCPGWWPTHNSCYLMSQGPLNWYDAQEVSGVGEWEDHDVLWTVLLGSRRIPGRDHLGWGGAGAGGGPHARQGVLAGSHWCRRARLWIIF